MLLKKIIFYGDFSEKQILVLIDEIMIATQLNLKNIADQYVFVFFSNNVEQETNQYLYMSVYC